METFTGDQAKWAKRAAEGNLVAAGKLFKSALPGWEKEVDPDGTAVVFDHRELNPDFPEGFTGNGDTPAAALLDAITKAVKSAAP
jgi:hypothetical protein